MPGGVGLGPEAAGAGEGLLVQTAGPCRDFQVEALGCVGGGVSLSNHPLSSSWGGREDAALACPRLEQRKEIPGGLLEPSEGGGGLGVGLQSSHHLWTQFPPL